MRTRRSFGELAIWAILAFGGGALAGQADLASHAVQGPALLLMLTNFALTLPGRAPVLLIAVCSWIAMPAVRGFVMHEVNPGILIALVPAFVAAAGGSLAGKLLDTTASRLVAETDGSPAAESSMLPTRAVLAVALLCIGAIGVGPTRDLLAAVGHPLSAWLATIWQVLTLLGWIVCTPMVLLLGRSPDESSSVTAIDLVRHVVTIVALAAIHATLLVTITRLLFIPVTPSAAALIRVAATVYLPLDALTYIAIVSLSYASDAERHRRDAQQREAAARAASLDDRLAALRARLNPHFLFNALNAVHSLSQAGRSIESSRMVEGLTDLLRYVLDERHAFVPLRDELAFIGRYLELQRTRFGHRLSYSIAADPGAEAALVPQLVLQPIVENAVEHGMSDSLEGGEVIVRAQRTNEALTLTVDDAGRAAEATNGLGIGLANTRERLATLFRDRATIAVEPRPSGGTRVTIELPMSVSESA